VAAEETVRARHDADDAGKGKKTVRRVSAAGEDDKVAPRGKEAASRSAVAMEKPSRGASPDPSRPNQPPLPAGRGDPFDAAVFNRGADRSVR
jgi:hypothetical protein